MITIDRVDLNYHIEQGQLLNKAAQLLELADYAKQRIKSQQDIIDQWKPYDIGLISHWEAKIKITQAAHDRILNAYKNQIDKLYKSNQS